MYYLMECYAPVSARGALIDYTPDKPPGQVFRRNWKNGRRFATPPPLPVMATIPAPQAGQILEMHTDTLPLMTQRLAEALKAAGVDNIEFFAAQVIDEKSGERISTHVAFNIVGAIAAADLENSIVAGGRPLIAGAFDAMAIDASKAAGAKLFRLAEAVTAIVVHESVKVAVEAKGIDTVSFVRPSEWVG